MRENSARSHFDVPLPIGADPADATDWEIFDGVPERLVWSSPMAIPDDLLGGVFHIRVVATQRADGSLVPEGADAPAVFIDHTPYTPADVRDLADAMRFAADLAEKWAGQ